VVSPPDRLDAAKAAGWAGIAWS